MKAALIIQLHPNPLRLEITTATGEALQGAVAELTPADARELAKRLMRAADDHEAVSVTNRGGVN